LPLLVNTNMASTPGIHSSVAKETATKDSAARLSIVVAVFLIALKTTSGWMTGSISVWASLLDSVLDLFASTLNSLQCSHHRGPPMKITLTVTVKPNL
jgi:divalent metal cation (Fe/Co/Zn/Cd) transporter